jgi:cytoskeletal protein CcmA (bactofilin family)
MAIFGKDGRPGGAAGPGGEGTLSVVAQGLHISGDVRGGGLLKVDGRVDGSITGPRQVIVGRDGAVRGNVEAAEVILAGTIEGSILGADRVEVQSTALLHGDIETRSIVVHEGARLNGNVLMGTARSASDSASDTPVQMVR